VSIRYVAERAVTLAQPVYPRRFGYTPDFLLPYLNGGSGPKGLCIKRSVILAGRYYQQKLAQAKFGEFAFYELG
jgi:hypothetical protein